MTEKQIIELIECKLASYNFVPVGSIFAFPSEKIPQGFLPCEGQELSSSQYPELFKLIGTAFGGKNKTFCLPDLQGQFIRGLDREGNIDLDDQGNIRKIGSLQQHSFQGHAHSIDTSSLEISSAGGHDHDLYWAEFTVRDYSYNDFNNHEQCFAMPYADRNKKDYYGRTSAEAFTKDGTTVEGEHIHSIVLKGNTNCIGSPVSASYGSVSDKISFETRPKNMALIFCIKVG